MFEASLGYMRCCLKKNEIVIAGASYPEGFRDQTWLPYIQFACLFKYVIRAGDIG